MKQHAGSSSNLTPDRLQRSDSSSLPGRIKSAEKTDAQDRSQCKKDKFQVYKHKTSAWRVGQDAPYHHIRHLGEYQGQDDAENAAGRAQDERLDPDRFEYVPRHSAYRLQNTDLL